MTVKMSEKAAGFYVPATSGDRATMASFGVYDRFPTDHLFSADELRRIAALTGLRFLRPI